LLHRGLRVAMTIKTLLKVMNSSLGNSISSESAYQQNKD
jgi:hypothetical protein